MPFYHTFVQKQCSCIGRSRKYRQNDHKVSNFIIKIWYSENQKTVEYEDNIIEQSFSVFYDFTKQKVLQVAYNLLLSEMGLYTMKDAVFTQI